MIQNLPSDLSTKILSYLPLQSIKNIRRVSKIFYISSFSYLHIDFYCVKHYRYQDR